MKKFLAMLLVLTCTLACAFTLFSCDDPCEQHVDEDGDLKCDVCEADITPPPPAEPDGRVDFVSAMAATVPTKLYVEVTTSSALGELKSTYDTVYSQTDASFTVTYYTEKFNTGFDSLDDKIISDGTITCNADGTYSDGGAFAGSNPAASGVKLNLNSDKLTNCIISGDTLTATVAAADTAEVLGAQYGADVTLVLTKNAGKIVSVSVTYGAAPETVNILCVYN